MTEVRTLVDMARACHLMGLVRKDKTWFLCRDWWMREARREKAVIVNGKVVML